MAPFCHVGISLDTHYSRMNHKLIFLLLCLMLSPCVDGWLFSRRRSSSTTVTYNNLYDVTCNANCIINGRRKRSAGSSEVRDTNYISLYKI